MRLREWMPVGANQFGGTAASAETDQGGRAPGAYPSETEEGWAPGAYPPQADIGWAPGAHPLESKGSTQQESVRAVSQQTGLSERTLKQAKVVNANAVRAVQDAVLRSTVSLKAAEKIARLPQQEQGDALESAKAPKPRKSDSESRAVARPKQPSDEEPDAAASAETLARLAFLEDEVVHLQDALSATREELDAAARVLDASDPVSAALKEAECERALARGLQSRLDGLMREVAELKRSVKFWQRKAESAGEAA